MKKISYVTISWSKCLVNSQNLQTSALPPSCRRESSQPILEEVFCESSLENLCNDESYIPTVSALQLGMKNPWVKDVPKAWICCKDARMLLIKSIPTGSLHACGYKDFYIGVFCEDDECCVGHPTLLLSNRSHLRSI